MGEIYDIQKRIDNLEDEERQYILSPQQILDSIPNQSGNTVLDAGVGAGYLTVPVAEQGAKEVVALDSNPEVLDVITKKADAKNLKNITVMNGDITNLHFESEVFDTIFAGFIVDSVPLKETIFEFGRILKRGGSVVAVEVNPSDDDEIPKISANNLRKEFENQGLQVEPEIRPNDENYILRAVKK